MAINLVSRVQKLLISPKSEWDAIDTEPTDTMGILTTYSGPLIILAQVAALVGLMVFGISVLGITFRPPITGLLINAVISVVLSIAMIYVFAFIVDALAPSFGGQKNFNQAFKLAAYFPTAAWIGGLLAIFPPIGWIGSIAGVIYSLYLLFVGLPKLMKPPADKAVVYTLVSIVVFVVLWFVIFYVVSRVTAGMMTPTIDTSTITFPTGQ